MHILHESVLWALLDRVVGTVRTVRLFEALDTHRSLLQPRAAVAGVSRAELAQALNMLLFEGVTRRVPMASAYVGDAVRCKSPTLFSRHVGRNHLMNLRGILETSEELGHPIGNRRCTASRKA